MKFFSALAILAYLAYQASSLPVATTSAAEKREVVARTGKYFYDDDSASGKREVVTRTGIYFYDDD